MVSKFSSRFHLENYVDHLFVVMTNTWKIDEFLRLADWSADGLRAGSDEETASSADREEPDRFDWSCA